MTRRVGGVNRCVVNLDQEKQDQEVNLKPYLEQSLIEVSAEMMDEDERDEESDDVKE